MKKLKLYLAGIGLCMIGLGMHASHAQATLQGTWATQADNYKNNIGQRFTFYFPPGGTISSRVWGTDVYTYDCSIASAAVHAGLITTRNGGTVTIEIRPGQSSYTGSVRHGVTSSNWGPYGGSFVFVNGNQDNHNPPSTSDESTIWNNGNIDAVQNGPTNSTIFVLTKTTYVTRIENYHYFNRGVLPGTISIRSRSGQTYGPWSCYGKAGQGAVHNATWVAEPNIQLPAGSYTVIDSDPGTWSYNYRSGNSGFTLVAGIEKEQANATVIQGLWITQANDYKNNIGQRYTFYFPPGGTIFNRVWGTDIYTYDCSIASAAVHAGLITTQSGGTVTIEIRAGQSSYRGSIRNGVTSMDWGAFDGSFVFVR